MQDMGEDIDEDLAWLTQKIEDPKSNKKREPYFPPTHTQLM